jgi:ribosomal protein L7/L12
MFQKRFEKEVDIKESNIDRFKRHSKAFFNIDKMSTRTSIGVLDSLSQHSRLEAIRLLKKETRLGLKELKEFIDGFTKASSVLDYVVTDKMKVLSLIDEAEKSLFKLKELLKEL